MSATFLRSAGDIDKITIGYDENNGRYDLIENINMPGMNDVDLINKIFDGNIGLTYKDLVSRAKIITNQSNYHVEKKLIPVWYANKLIQKNGNLIQICRLF